MYDLGQVFVRRLEVALTVALFVRRGATREHLRAEVPARRLPPEIQYLYRYMYLYSIESRVSFRNNLECAFQAYMK